MATSLLDFAILAVDLVGVVAFGLWIGRDQKGAADYMLGTARSSGGAALLDRRHRNEHGHLPEHPRLGLASITGVAFGTSLA